MEGFLRLLHCCVVFRFNEPLLKAGIYSNWFPIRSNVLGLLRGSFLELRKRLGICVNSKRHPALAMISLSTIKPQRLVRLDFEFDGFECNETSGILGDVGRLESGENSARDGFAGVFERRLDK